MSDELQQTSIPQNTFSVDQKRWTRVEALRIVLGRYQSNKQMEDMLVEADLIMAWLYDGTLPASRRIKAVEV